ncbi:MAG TPA: hypothetical protein DEF36_02280 [Desulfotomaculum sp.]|nr:hypothetical protein [Desulfotomaculum sp.]
MANPRVAIIGAGAAGLSCAHELERLGCQPVIYEISRSDVVDYIHRVVVKIN